MSLRRVLSVNVASPVAIMMPGEAHADAVLSDLLASSETGLVLILTTLSCRFNGP